MIDQRAYGLFPVHVLVWSIIFVFRGTFTDFPLRTDLADDPELGEHLFQIYIGSVKFALISKLVNTHFSVPSN
jgi:hypothetical protein